MKPDEALMPQALERLYLLGQVGELHVAWAVQGCSSGLWISFQLAL